MTKQETANYLIEMNNNNIKITVNSLDKYTKGLKNAVYKYYHGIYSALKELDINQSVPHKLSNEEIGDILFSLYQKHHVVSSSIIKQCKRISLYAIEKRFGTLNNALKYFNIPTNKFHRNVTKEELDNDLYKLYDEYGYVSKSIVEKHGLFGPKIINRIYGNFANMYNELGITRHPSGIILTTKELLDDAEQILNKFGDLTTELITQEARSSATCYKDRFGSINNLRKHFGLKANLPGMNKNDKSSLSAMYAIKKIAKLLNEEPEYEKTFEWLVNPKTGYKLRLDGYFPIHKIAVEYNGPQHYKYCSYYKNIDEFKNRQYLDNLKNELCIKNGVKILWIKYTDKLTNEYLEKLISGPGR